MSDFVLDTSALLAYIEDEEGADDVETLIVNALDDTNTIFVSMVTCIEIYYISIQEQGIAVAEDRLKLIDELPFVQEPLDRELITTIGKIKASRSMSFADACIAGLAMAKNAVLVHKDPEFEQLKEVEQIKLKYKKSR